MKTQEAQVIMLPTDKASHIHLVPKGEFEDVNGQLIKLKESKLLFVDKATEFGYAPYFIYIINDEPIKDNDIVIEYNNGAGKPYYRLFKKGHLETILIHHTKQPFTNYWIRKVVATTNPDLWSKTLIEGQEGHFLNKPLPKISIEFVEAYVKEQGRIDKVLLEYEIRDCLRKPRNGGSICAESPNCEDWIMNTSLQPKGIDCNHRLHLKLKSNGSVIVHPVKEKMYSKKELIAFSVWHSGMKTEQVERAFNRYLIEQHL